MELADFKLLWRMPSPVDPDKYIFISLEDSPERYAFQVADDAPIAIAARTYYDTVKKCEAMPRLAFENFVQKWVPQTFNLMAKDEARATGFYAAIEEVERRIREHEAEQLAQDVAYLFDEQETP